MKALLSVIPLIFYSLLLAQTYGGKMEAPRLATAFQDDFLIGAAIQKTLFENEKKPILDLVARQFNSISSCNMLKWKPFNPMPGQYNHGPADAYVEFGNKNDMYTVGHVLFWYKNTPEWVFLDASGHPVGREELLTRMRERVKYVASRYENKINAWDVVNETFMADGGLRDSHWTRILDKDFIEQAFRIADEALPSNIELLYNDYSMTSQPKRAAVVQMIRDLKQKGVRIDGLGMQGHWSLNWPSIQEIETSIIAFADAGVDVHITELDIDVLPRKQGMEGADVDMQFQQEEAMDPYRNGLPDDIQQKLAERYSDIFRLFLKHKDKVKRITFWGTTDKYSWLNNWPIEGRTSYPLLFDRDGRPKPAFDSLLGLKHNEVDNVLEAARQQCD